MGTQVKRPPQLKPQEGEPQALNTRDKGKTVTSGKAKSSVYFATAYMNFKNKHTLSYGTVVICRCGESNKPTFNAF